MLRPAPVYVVASPNQKVGKTLIARLLIEFFQASGRAVKGYDLPSRKPALADRFPHLVRSVDIGDTRGQMQVFDQLLADNTTTRIVDLGSGPFDQFFAVMDKIDFVTEARRRFVEPIVLFVADAETETARTYAELRSRLKPTIFVPVHNEAVSVTFAAADFPASRVACGAIRVARLSPLVRRVIDRPNFSFGAYITEPGGVTQVHQWICPIVTRFRELELQLLAGRLATFLGGLGNQATFGRGHTAILSNLVAPAGRVPPGPVNQSPHWGKRGDVP